MSVGLAYQSVDLSWVAGVRSTEDGTIFTINHDNRPAPRSTGGNRRNGEHSNIKFNCRQFTPATPPVIKSTDCYAAGYVEHEASNEWITCNL